MTKSMRPSREDRLAIILRDSYRCTRCACDVTCLQSGEVHHRLPRRMGGTRDIRSNDPRNLVLLCTACHGEVESHRALARDTGWLLRSYDDLDTPAISKDGRRVYLTTDGQRTDVIDAASILAAAVLQ